ncbi:MAG: serine/threonine protein kinase [Nitrospinae bacterium]|nr:serine/threonine protein kinase [Nitrospinota bacterium]
MNKKEVIAEKSNLCVFQNLTPDTVINLVEKAIGELCTNICRPLNSYINRVFELETEEGKGLVAKFYRPERWSKKALLDEQEFLLELAEAEIPVIPPIQFTDKSTLGIHENMYFAVFPKKGGRFYDEYTEEQWLELGRLIGRTHAVGAKHLPKDRVTMTPDKLTTDQINYLLNGNFMDKEFLSPFKELSHALLDEITPFFKDTRLIRIQGDCHFSNLIYRPGESFYLIDFDDMAIGPPVQDFWMLLPGYKEDSHLEIDIFLEGYETFMDFDWRSLRLIEPLRAMRYIHYTAWCAHQFAEDGLSRVAEDFGSREYWQREIKDLTEQLERIQSTPVPTGNY